MENLIAKKENDCNFISVLIPTVNGSLAKLLLLTCREVKLLNIAYKTNIGKNRNIYSLYSESNFNYEGHTLGMGRLTKLQFDLLLKDKYNANPQKYKNGRKFKNAV